MHGKNEVKITLNLNVKHQAINLCFVYFDEIWILLNILLHTRDEGETGDDGDMLQNTHTEACVRL